MGNLWGEAAGAALPQKLAIGATLQEPQMGASGAEQAQAFEWRVTRPPEPSDSREWVLLPPSQSQLLAGLLEQFDQLSMGSIAQPPPTGQPGWVLAQPMFTFLGPGTMTIQSGALASFHSVRSGSHLSLSCRAWSTGMTAPAGIGAAPQQGLLRHSNLGLRGETLGLLRPPRTSRS